MTQHIEFPYDVDPTGQGFFWPASEQKRRDYFAVKRLRPLEAESVYQCRPGGRIGTIFVEADFRYYEAPPDLELGRASQIVRNWIDGVNGIIAQGWDTAMSAQSTADYSACVTTLFVPCDKFHRDHEAALLGDCDQHYDAYILDVFRKRMDIGDLVLAIKEQALKWNPEKIVVEKKASGASAMQALASSGLPLEGVAPQENKRDRAVNGGAGAGSVQGWFRSGRVLFPAHPPTWLHSFITELKDFTGEKGGRDDQVDAMVHVISWGIREGSLSVRFPLEWQQGPDQIDRLMNAPEGPFRIFSGNLPVEDTQLLIEEGVIFDPFGDRCGRCRHYRSAEKLACTYHKRVVSAIHSACEAFDDGSAINAFPRF